MSKITVEDRWTKLKVYLEAERERWPKKHRHDLRERVLNLLSQWPESKIWVTIQETPQPSSYLLRVVPEKGCRDIAAPDNSQEIKRDEPA